MRSMKIALMLLIGLTSFSAFADELKNLKLRVEGHVRTMMEGQRTPLLTVKDYYSPVYITSKATVEEVKKLSNGKFVATIKFETVKRIHQDLEQTPMKKNEEKKKEEIRVSLPFRVQSKSLQWLEKLETPFVKEGSEERYLFKVQKKESKKETSAGS